MKFIVADEVFEKIPDAIFGTIVAKGIDNSVIPKGVDALLKENIAACEAFYEGKKVKESDEVVCYREAMSTLGFNPNKYMCSIEALLTRIAKKKGFPSINGAVDLGNAVSLKYKVPLGAHDIDSFEGDLEVRAATAEDKFRPFGAAEDEFDNPDEGEIIYVSGNSVRTRRWTWRQSEAGKITENVKNIFFPIDGFGQVNKDAVIAARDELAAKIEEFFGVKTVTGFVDSENRAFDLDV